MQVTLGEEGSAASKAQPFFLPASGTPDGNMGDWPPLTLPLLRRRRLREAESAGADEGSRPRPGLIRAWVEGMRFAVETVEVTDEEDGLALKQMKKSPAPPEELLLWCGWDLSTVSIVALFFFMCRCYSE